MPYKLCFNRFNSKLSAKSENIIREYSEKTVYYKSLNVWKSHLGVDFAGEIGDEVTAMTGGAVIKVDEDKLYGKQ